MTKTSEEIRIRKEERMRIAMLVAKAIKEDTSSFGHVMCSPDFAVKLKDLCSWLEGGAFKKPPVTKYTFDDL